MMNIETLKYKAQQFQARATAEGLRLAQHPRIQQLKEDPKVQNAVQKSVAFGTQAATEIKTRLRKLEARLNGDKSVDVPADTQ